MADIIRWGILGCGNVTEIKSGPGFQKAHGSTVTACMRRDGDKAADYARRHDIARWYDRGDDLINDPEVDAVYVATPPGSHKEYVLKAAAAGKPVYVEKPPAPNAPELEEMITACDLAGVPLFVAYYRRGQEVFNKVKELIAQGAVGEVRSMNLILRKSPEEIVLNARKTGEALPWRYNKELSGGGLFVDLGSHQLDILDWILGPVSQARGFAVNRAGMYDVEDGLAASFLFESGVIGTGLWDFAAAPDAGEDMIEITGARGKISFSAFAHMNIVLEGEEGRREWNMLPPDHVEQPLIQLMTDQLLGRGLCPSTGETALRTSRVIDSLLGEYYRDH